jgi:hypothetical protein
MFLDSINCTYIGMIQSRGSLCFLEKTSFCGFIVVHSVREKLESNIAIQFGIQGFIDYAHAALSELFKNIVM